MDRTTFRDEIQKILTKTEEQRERCIQDQPDKSDPVTREELVETEELMQKIFHRLANAWIETTSGAREKECHVNAATNAALQVFCAYALHTMISDNPDYVRHILENFDEAVHEKLLEFTVISLQKETQKKGPQS